MSETTLEQTTETALYPLDTLQADLESRKIGATPCQDAVGKFLIVPLFVDDQYRDHVLTLRPWSSPADDDVIGLTWTCVFPYSIMNLSNVPNLARVLFLLNQYLPLGAYGMSEDPLAIYFRHVSFQRSGSSFSTNAECDVIPMLTSFLSAHGQIIDCVIDGSLQYEELAEQFQSFCLPKANLFSR
ncbi:hypothetical protein [Roseiconus lacunae]|uniref:hypothetical protein n=1 Tax=Roseiconus lacunae TaxID=2605694 RepID=UPI001E5C3792|nr:hypothetical protein [Roseiconus lacunae]MCD0457906.1 hypothetical protein [Roseiconus lacunae]